MNQSDSLGMTIEELSAQSGVTTRNIRAYQSKSLLPPPKTHQRVGFYNEGHLARLKLITSMQKQGFSLSGIAELLGAWEKGKSLDEVLGFERALTINWGQKPKLYNEVEVKKMLGPIEFTDKLIRRIEKLGLLTREKGGYRIHPKVFEMGVESVKAGVPLDVVIHEAEAALKGAKKMADRLISIYLKYVWGPYIKEGQPPEKLAQITEIIQRFRTLATEISVVLIGDTLEASMEKATGEYMKKSQASMKKS